ncbi:MAG: transcription-repair coupling factor [Kiritimatiellae bacterium]|nr:transcription-repair coupling factor [Kiritimatiellia bacterium]
MTEINKILEKFEKIFWAAASSPSPKISLSSFTGSAAAFSAIALAGEMKAKEENRPPFVLVVTPGLPEADTICNDLTELGKYAGVRVLEFPPLMGKDVSIASARIKTASAISSYSIRPYPLVVVAPYLSLIGDVPKIAAIASLTVRLDLSSSVIEGGLFSLFEKLQKAGYERVTEVEEEGQFASRGGILDVWPPDEEYPVRAEFFGDDLESLRYFDAGTQVSHSKIDSIEINPIETGADDSEDKYSLLDVIPEKGTVLWVEHNEYQVFEAPRAARQLFSGDPPPKGVPSVQFQTSPLPGFSELGAEAARMPELLEATRNKFYDHLKISKEKGLLFFESNFLSIGFELFDKDGGGITVVTKSDRVFAHRGRVNRSKLARVTGSRFVDRLDVDPGELVVHIDYGIGRFEGATEIEVGGKRSEVFTIVYANNLKIHVPTAHTHLLSRYVGVKGEHVKLHSIDGKRWDKEKKAAEKSVFDLAAALLETQAKRALVPGFAYDVTFPEIDAFDEMFPYEATPDQVKAIESVRQDMAQTKPMDRLICGDAGYGKTEVAMRAAFVAVMNGKQVAVLAPTTVLAEQHYESFLSRFDGMPVHIEVMSRIQSTRSKKNICSRLLSGGVDILIGTHSILSKSVVFKDLGLIIIDEEQRFGVKQKEHLKRLRTTADVLTMSATPIPRTLYMSMTGARDLSLLRSPPRERIAVETRIIRSSDAAIKDAIEKELSRCGQVYYLYNRVATIELAYHKIKNLVPDAKVEIAHGQMPVFELSEKMRRFFKGEIDILLCTTIVESGIDNPRANTIIVDRADRFGMADLYQLRGRVGRSSRKGYAYFLLPESGDIDSDARERLDALKKHAGLGAGFNLSMRDLEIRGAGNLLGSEQSGHIAAVGFQLYCQLLNRTMARLKGEKVNDIVEVSISLDFLDFSPGSSDLETSGACLPYEYVEEEVQRIEFHKRIAEIATLDDLYKISGELADRYGKLPKAVQRLIRLVELKVRCAGKGVTHVLTNSDMVYFRKGEKYLLRLPYPKGNPDKKLNALIDAIKKLTL